jgi:hypothetical protein
MKWYKTTVTMARTPRVLAREYRESWVIMVKLKDCAKSAERLEMKRHH